MDWFQWRVLPQDMANSPTVAQKYVAQAIHPICEAWPQANILLYMDDIFLGAPTKAQALQCFQQLQIALSPQGLKIAPNKSQFQATYSYLAF